MKFRFFLQLLLFVSIFFLLSFKKTDISSKIDLNLGVDYETSLTKDVKNAKKSIFCVIYLIKPNFKMKNDVVTALLDELIKAHKRGVKVSVVADRNVTFWKKSKSDKKKVECHSSEALEYLQKGGVNVFVDPTDVITHSKVVVIDEKIVHLGSTNWSYSAFRRNNECNIRVLDQKLAQKLQVQLHKIKVEAYDKNINR